MKKFAPIAACLALTACGGSSVDSQTQELWIAQYKVPCAGESSQLCRLEKSTPNGEWTLAYDVIQDFEAKWGHSYRILVDLEPIPNPPADGSSIKRRLGTVLEDKEDPAGTEYFIQGVPQNVPALGRYEFGYTFYEERIHCTSVDACSGLFSSSLHNTSGNTYGSGELVTLQLRYTGDDVSLPVELVGWSYTAP